MAWSGLCSIPCPGANLIKPMGVNLAFNHAVKPPKCKYKTFIVPNMPDSRRPSPKDNIRPGR